MVRTAFHDRLDALAAHLAGMCQLAGQTMDQSTQALLQTDLVMAEEVIARGEQFTRKTVEAEQRALVLLATQAPVAGDLRAVVSTLKNAADADRMGALALHVAKITRRRHPAKVLPEEVNGYFAEMGRLAVELGNSAHDVVLAPDPERAARIRAEDDAMDDLHRHLFTVLMHDDWDHGVTCAVDITLLSRYYERFADHAVQIAQRVIYQITGSDG